MAIFKECSFKGLFYLCNKDAKKLKNIIKYILQKVFGLHNYLFLFARYVIIKFPFDKNERTFLRFLDLIKVPGTVLDIGANVGVTTYFCSKKIRGSTIYSFEPVEDNLKVLEKIVRKFRLKNVNIFPFALGNENVNVDMVMPEANGVFFHGLSHITQMENNVEGKSYNVQMRRLDNIEELSKQNIIAIKLDVEDYEYQVLLGGENLIGRNRPMIYCELWETENRKYCFDFFSKLNYKIYVYKQKKFDEYTGEGFFQNFIFVPAECCDKMKL